MRDMRRFRQLLSEEETLAALKRGTSGVLALYGDEGYPYAVPLSYAYSDGKIFFHSAKSGHKLDAIARNEKASFCVIDLDDVQPQDYSTNFRSVIAFGRVRILTERADIMSALRILGERYAGEGNARCVKEVEGENGLERIRVIEFQIEHMTGKEAIELVREKNKA